MNHLLRLQYDKSLVYLHVYLLRILSRFRFEFSSNMQPIEEDNV